MKRADADPAVRFAMRMCIALAIAALFAAAWWLSGVLMLLFGGVILAVALHAGASRLVVTGSGGRDQRLYVEHNE